MDVPEFNDELVDMVAAQSDDQSGQWSIRELERIRDDNLVGIMEALRRPLRKRACQGRTAGSRRIQTVEPAQRPRARRFRRL
jgi:hypothetical protein